MSPVPSFRLMGDGYLHNSFLHRGSLTLFCLVAGLSLSAVGWSQEEQPGVDEQLGILNEEIADLSQEGRYHDATKVAEQAVALAKSAYGHTHFMVALSMTELAKLHMAEGQPLKAAPLLEESIPIVRREMGSYHPAVARLLATLGEVYKTQKNLDKAEEAFLKALYVWNRSDNPADPMVARARNQLGDLYGQQKEYAKAETLFSRSLVNLIQVLGEEHPDVAVAMHNLSWAYYAQGRYKKAQTLCEQALGILDKHGQDHPHLPFLLKDMETLYRLLGEPAKANQIAGRLKALGGA